MRYICLLLFTFTSSFVFGQALTKHNELAKELNYKLKEELFRGSTYITGFTVDSLIHISPRFNESKTTLGFDQKIHSVLMSSKQDLSDGFYGLQIYWDLYSDSTYTTIYKPRIVEEGSFPNYTNLVPDPYYGPSKFFKTFISDIIRNDSSSFNTKKKYYLEYGFFDEIEVLIDKKGNAKLLSKYGITEILDSTKMIKWTPAIYYGSPRNSVLSFNVTRAIFQNSARPEVEWNTGEIFFLDDLFQGQIVRFEESYSIIPEGKLLLSFVFNPMTNKLENPFIHRGDLQQGKDLIHWIENHDYSEIFFYWDDFPEAKRIYFYIK